MDYVTLNPKDFTSDELLAAARGETLALNPEHAVTLLHAKLGENAEAPLTQLAVDVSLDPRTRQAAVLELAPFSGARQVLANLATSDVALVADAASTALQQGST